MPSVKKSVPLANRQQTGKRAAPKTAFAPGKSGNPSGRPKKTQEEFLLEAACRAKTPDALGVMVGLMTTSRQDSVKLQAALSIIERAHGKPLQRSEIRTGPLDGLPPEEAASLLEMINAVQRARASSNDGRAASRAEVAGKSDRR